MKVGIIAAGVGERLAKNGVRIPKPLIPLGGEPMIARLIRTAARLSASSVACIVNALDPSVSAYLDSESWPVPLELLVRTTANSMESLLALAPLLGDEPFLLLTVDAVFPFDAVEKLLQRGKTKPRAAGVLALTRNLDDEKPLWARIDHNQKIVGLGEAVAGATPYATAGLYYFDPGIFALAGAARDKKLDALRRFLALLIDSGYPLYGLPVSRTIDVDYPRDIARAERLLREIGEIV